MDAGFTLQDFLGRHWQNERVRFPLSPDQLKHAEAGHALIGPDAKPVPYQLVFGEGPSTPAIEFLVDLEPYASRTYRFTPSIETEVTDLHVEETSDIIWLGNSRVGIALRKRLASDEGPMAAIRLASGRWIGNSLISTGQHISSYAAEVVAQGPVFAEVVCRLSFGAHQSWELRFTIQAYEPVILVDEIFSLGDGSAFVLALNQNFALTDLFYRYGKSLPGQNNAVGRLATWPLRSADKEPLFVLEPWLHWWERQRQGTWFGLYNDHESDLVAIGARQPAMWVDPAQKPEMRSSTQTRLSWDDGHLRWTLPLKGGARRWLLAALDRDTSLEPLHGQNLQLAPLPQQYLIKHGDFPLNQVKDYVLKWAGDEAGHPRLLLNEGNIARLRQTFHPDPGKLAQLAKRQLVEHQMDEPIAAYLATGDTDLGQHLTTTAVQWLQSAVNMFLRQEALVTLGFAPHHQSRLLTASNLADAIWSSEHVSPAMRQWLKAQVAFLAYTVNRHDYWSPPRGFSANPNMTTTVAAFQTLLACMIPAHPMARTWIEHGMRELKENQLDRWADAHGGWLEAPHYAMVSYDHLLGAFMATHNAGFNDYLYDPKMKQVMQWFAKISTPPDARSHGHRHLPPVGNTYMREPSGQFGIVASLWKDRDPQFAAEMQWMERQQGSYPAPGVGGFFPTLAGYRTLLTDQAIPEHAPAYTSEWFPQTGVILRDHFPSTRETQLYLIAGTNHAHYDRDSGSFTLWGKGRLIANDFGYDGEAPGEDHNMVVGPQAPDSALMHITEFHAGEHVDYVRGVKNDAWERQIVFIKDRDPLGPNYFVLSDRIKDGAPATWRAWFTAEKVVTEPQGALVQGTEDVDTDLFFARADEMAVATDEKTRDTWGLTEATYGRVSTTQIGVVVPLDTGFGLTAVLYPRLKGDARPVVTPLVDGHGVKVETAAGTDYVFLSDAPLTFHEGTLAFEGTVGAALRRHEHVQLWLGQAGRIAAHGRVLHKETTSAPDTK